MAASGVVSSDAPSAKRHEEVETVVIRFCGDSGDGMQLAGTQFTNVSAAAGGNDVSTLPDFPAEIRAPVGTLSGVSGYQISFSSTDIFTPGDQLDTLVAMNPAALKTNVADLKRGGTLIVNIDEFEKANLHKATYQNNPLDDPNFTSQFTTHKVPMTRLTRDAVEGLGLSLKEADRCKNFFALGLVYWMYERDPGQTEAWIRSKFGKNPAIAEANLRALKAGSNYGFSTDAFTVHYKVPAAKLPPGKYRKITGNEAVAFGLATAAHLASKTLVYAGYPITPASDILHELSMLKQFGVKTFQAEDEIAAMAAVVGAAFAGELAVTASSGPGICLKGEAMGLGVMTELPMVIIDVQRGGPSTGLPTKTEQSDLMLAMYGRNGDSPMPIVAAATPGDCFYMIQEAFRIAVEFMTPVIFLSDGYIGNGAEPWMIPKLSDLKPIRVHHPAGRTTPEAAAGNGHETGNGESNGFLPYKRDERLTRPWAIPGTPGLEHRIGGLEKADITGNIDYSPGNHEHMVKTRAQKTENVAATYPPQEVIGPKTGKLLVISWGGTFGAVRTAAQHAISEGKSVAHTHLRYLNPLPSDLGEIISRYEQVLVPELNNGQLVLILRAKYLANAIGLNKIQGKPFLVHEVSNKIDEMLKG